MNKVIILSFLLTTGLAFAGQIQGRVTFAGRPVGEKVKIEIKVPLTASPKSTETDRKSEYRIYVPAKGSGEIVVHYRLGNNVLKLSHDIVSQDNTVVYNLDIVQKGGRYILVTK